MIENPETNGTNVDTANAVAVVRFEDKKKKKKKKYSSRRAKRAAKVQDGQVKGLHRVVRAAEGGIGEWRKQRDKSARKHKDGALRDGLKNRAKAVGKFLRQASRAPADVTAGLPRPPTLRRGFKPAAAHIPAALGTVAPFLASGGLVAALVGRGAGIGPGGGPSLGAMPGPFPGHPPGMGPNPARAHMAFQHISPPGTGGSAPQLGAIGAAVATALASALAPGPLKGLSRGGPSFVAPLLLGALRGPGGGGGGGMPFPGPLPVLLANVGGGGRRGPLAILGALAGGGPGGGFEPPFMRR